MHLFFHFFSPSGCSDIKTERPLYSVLGTAYTENRAGTSWDEKVGEIYPYFNMGMSGEDTTSDEVLLYTSDNNNGTEVVLFHSGYCTRLETEGNVTANSTGIGYCHWSYCIEGYGKFVAQGAIGDPSQPSFLAIEGGNGGLTGASGYVEVYGVTPNNENFPEVADSGDDPFKDPEGFIHNVALTLDEYFVDGSMPIYLYYLDTPSFMNVTDYKCV